MKNIQEHFEQLEFLLQTISKQIEPFQQNEALKAKLNQLQAIEDTIQKLQKDKTPIPDDLRDLKLKLVCDTEEWQKAEKIKQKLHSLLKEYNYIFQPLENSIKQKKRRKRRKKKMKLGRRIGMIDLLNADIIPVDTMLCSTYKGIQYEGRINSNGKIVTKIDGKTQLFNSPSAAAVALTNLSQNGWTWWFVSNDGKKRELDYYRKEYLKNEAKR
jgi:hypothetical protein